MDNIKLKRERLAQSSSALARRVIYVFRASYGWRQRGGGAPEEAQTQAAARPWALALCLLSVLVLATTREGEVPLVFSRWSTALAAAQPIVLTSPEAVARVAGDHALAGPPSLSAHTIDVVLASYGSPATGQGAVFYALGIEYGIDPAYALAFFVHESTAGTNPEWAGNKSDGTTSHNIGNIICAGYPSCHGRFRDYASWEDGIRDWYRLIRDEYIAGRGLHTPAEVLPIYAPAADSNDPNSYASSVEALVERWRYSAP